VEENTNELHVLIASKAALTTETKQHKTNPKQNNFFVLGLFQHFVHMKQNVETKQK